MRISESYKNKKESLKITNQISKIYFRSTRDKEDLKKIRQLRRDALFHISRELKELGSSNLTNFEKLISAIITKSIFKEEYMSTSATESLRDKKRISDTQDEVDIFIEELNKNSSKQDDLDVDTILKVFNEDEEGELINIEEYIKGKDDLMDSDNLADIVKKYKNYLLELK